MNRRELIRHALVLVGGASLAGASFELFADTDPKARFFDATQYRLLEEVTDIMIPRTDTPGAVDAGVPAAFDALMKNWASRRTQRQFRNLLKEFDKAARKHDGKNLLALDRDRRTEVLIAYDKANATEAVYKKFRELVLTLYYMSEVGATQELTYEHVPGQWVASVKITPETRGWAM